MSDTVKTIRALAAAVGRTTGTVSKWRKRDDWPFTQRGPWDPVQVGVWAQETLRPDRSAPEYQAKTETKSDLDMEVKRQRAEKLRLENRVRRGELHDVAECRQRILRTIHQVKAGLLELPRRIVSACVDATNPVEVEEAAAAVVRQLLQSYADGVAPWSDEPAVEDDA